MLYESAYYGVAPLGDTVVHSGVKNMKHGVRRYQYPDGSLTPLGREHYGVGPARTAKTGEAKDGAGKSVPEGKEVHRALRNWNSSNYDSLSKEEQAECRTMYNKIRSDIYDWRNSKPKTAETKALVSKLKKLDDEEWDLRQRLRKGPGADKRLKSINEKQSQINDEINGSVLRSLGLEDTKKNRKAIHTMIRDD